MTTKSNKNVKVVKKVEIEEIYKRKTPHQHILDCPNMYVGSMQCTKKEMYVFDEKSKNIIFKNAASTEAMYKIVDEVLVNTRDQVVRTNGKCKNINIGINKTTGEISVKNDGPSVPVVLHKDEGIYVPHMIFGRLMTSSNYDTKGKIVGGLNGLGIKIVNIFSKQFNVDIVDSERKKRFQQEFKDNMYTVGEPKITNSKEDSYTCISFIPDYERFGLKKGLDDDHYSLLLKRCYDIAVCVIDYGVKVTLNGQLIKIKSFEDYIKMYFDEPPALVYSKINSRWNIGVVYSSDGGKNVSFVNGLCTRDGGSHEDKVYGQVKKGICDEIAKKHPNLKIGDDIIRNKIILFIDSAIEDPSFNSQVKDKQQMEYRSSIFIRWWKKCIFC